MYKILIPFVFCLALAAPSNATAEPMSVYGSADEPVSGPGGVALRAGVGSLFGPAFDAGQPEYAHSDGFDWENRRPFSTPRQLVMTYGVGASLTLSLGRWAVGPMLLAGFNATRSGSDDFSDISLDERFTGLTLGAGLHAARGTGPVRLTLDVIGSRSSLRGSVDWSYADFFGSETLVGSGEWQLSYVRVAAMAGVEIVFSHAFVFLNAGAQFLPHQERTKRESGSFPEAHVNDPFNVAVVSNVERPGATIVTIDDELSFAATAGVGLRF